MIPISVMSSTYAARFADPKAVAELRERRARGEGAREMLLAMAARGLGSLDIRYAFAAAFDLEWDACSPISGWLPGGGGELSVEEVAAFLDRELSLPRRTP